MSHKNMQSIISPFLTEGWELNPKILIKPNFKHQIFLTKIELRKKGQTPPKKKTNISSVKTRQKSGRTELLTISNFKVCTNTEPNQVRVNTTLILRIR